MCKNWIYSSSPTAEDVCRLLNWPLDVSAPMYGYRVGEDETPIFITYKKSQEDKRSDVYDNELQNGTTLKWKIIKKMLVMKF